jgi:hypothetical protein
VVLTELDKRFFVQFGFIAPTQLGNLSDDPNQAELAPIKTDQRLLGTLGLWLFMTLDC